MNLRPTVPTAATTPAAPAQPAPILGKLDLRDRVQAVVLAYESGPVVPGAAG